MKKECLTSALSGLVKKYNPDIKANFVVANNSEEVINNTAKYIFVPGFALIGSDNSNNIVPVLPWRQSRRYIELRNLFLAGTIEDVSMVRSRCMVSPKEMSLAEVFYREFDLLEWILNSEICSVFASINGDSSANLVLKLESGICCGMEISVLLPEGENIKDRHELIARRGVVCDQVVDAIVRPESVYLFSSEKIVAYTDTDSELFGLSESEITVVRAAHWAIKESSRLKELQNCHEHLVNLVDLAFKSNKECRRLEIERAIA